MKIITMGLIITGMVSGAHAADITLRWDASDPPPSYYLLSMSMSKGEVWTDIKVPGDVTEFIWPEVPGEGLAIWKIAGVYESKQLTGCIDCGALKSSMKYQLTVKEGEK